MPKPELNLFGLEKRKGLNLQIAGGPSADGAAFMPFPANPPPVQRPRVPSRTIRDVLPENARYLTDVKIVLILCAVFKSNIFFK